MAERYRKASKKEKKKILDEFTDITGMNRSYAATLLRGHSIKLKSGKVILRGDITKVIKKKGRKKYYDEKVVEKLKEVWRIMDFICGKRLKAVMNEALDNLKEKEEMNISEEVEKKLREISASTIDRLLKKERKKLELKGRKGTKPGTLLKHKIPIRTFADWNENRVGFMEIDLVGHDGGNECGDFAQTLDMTDIYSGWTETKAVKNKAHKWVFEAIKEVRKSLPFDLLGIDSDTGGEFINHALYKYCIEEKITFTRGRSYRKNDNCYVEQKNYSVVRRAVGYFRYDTDEEVQILNTLYSYLRLYSNHFQPVMKLVEKVRIGSKVRKKYDNPKTPYQRLIESNFLSEDKKKLLMAQHKNLSLLELKRSITKCQNMLLKIQKQKKSALKPYNYTKISSRFLF